VTGAPAAPARAPASPFLVASLAVSALSLALPAAFGPIGPLAAGVLAFVGHRAVRKSGGALRGPGLAKIAMTIALALFLLQAWAVVRGAASAAAWAGIRARLAAVEETLRTGTAEGAYELLSPEARAATERAPWTAATRDALAALGPLVSLGEPRSEGGDWERTGEFGEGESADLRLPVAFDAEFRGGRGRVELEFSARRRGPEVTTGRESRRGGPAPRYN
jgi:hypothetical protein